MTVFSKKKKATHTCNIILKTVNASEFIVSTNSVACIAWWFPISSHFHCPLLTHLGLFARPTKTAILRRLLTVTHKCCHRVQRIFCVTLNSVKFCSYILQCKLLLSNEESNMNLTDQRVMRLCYKSGKG